MRESDKILVTGGTGFVGSNLSNYLKNQGYKNVFALGSKDCDLTKSDAVLKCFNEIKPDYIFMTAGTVGGIKANRDYPVEFFTQNMLMAINSLEAASVVKPKKCVYLGSSCIYPKMATQPIQESALLSGYLEPTNEAYALAKIGGVKLASYYRSTGKLNVVSAMPPNVYGVNDNLDIERSHVLSALIQKIHTARKNDFPSVTLWGTGTPLREFIFAQDLSRALKLVMDKYDSNEPINCGTGEEISIKSLADAICEVINYRGNIIWDSSMPDGTPRKIMNNTKIRDLGFVPQVGLKEGIKLTYEWFLKVKSTH